MKRFSKSMVLKCTTLIKLFLDILEAIRQQQNHHTLFICILIKMIVQIC